MRTISKDGDELERAIARAGGISTHVNQFRLLTQYTYDADTRDARAGYALTVILPRPYWLDAVWLLSGIELVSSPRRMMPGQVLALNAATIGVRLPQTIQMRADSRERPNVNAEGLEVLIRKRMPDTPLINNFMILANSANKQLVAAQLARWYGYSEESVQRIVGAVYRAN